MTTLRWNLRVEFIEPYSRMASTRDGEWERAGKMLAKEYKVSIRPEE
jgi:hypothetical protein